MTRRTRRGISAYARALTSPVQFDQGSIGQRVMFFDGIPVFESDFMVDTETIASGAFGVRPAAPPARSSPASWAKAASPASRTAASRSKTSAPWRRRTPAAGASSGTSRWRCSRRWRWRASTASPAATSSPEWRRTQAASRGRPSPGEGRPLFARGLCVASLAT